MAVMAGLRLGQIRVLKNFILSEEFQFRLYLFTLFVGPYIFFSSRDALGLDISPYRLFSSVLGLLIFLRCFREKKILFPVNTKIVMVLFLYAMAITFVHSLISLMNPTFFKNISSEHSIFRAPEGRVFAQLISFSSYVILNFFLALIFSMRDRRNIRPIIYAIYYSGLLMACYGLIHWAMAQFGDILINHMYFWKLRNANFNPGGINVQRFYSLGGEPKMVGSFLLTPLVLSFYLNRPFFERLALFISYFFTFSTSALIGGIMFLGPFIVFMLWMSKKSFFKLFLGVFFFFLITIYQFATNEYFYNFISSGFIQKVKNLSVLGPFSPTTFDVLPLVLMKDYFLKADWHFLFGNGIGRLPYVGSVYFHTDQFSEYIVKDCRPYLLKFLIDTGFIGLGLFGYIFITRLVTHIKNFKKNSLDKILFLSLLASLASHATEANFLVWTFIGISFGYESIKKGHIIGRA